MEPQSRPIPVEKLTLIATGESFQDRREPQLRIGDRVELNSGGPLLLVVEDAAETLTVAWRGQLGVSEATFPRACLHRWRP
jgi:uncharacterized protein YodC (DUF2158 family)